MAVVGLSTRAAVRSAGDLLPASVPVLDRSERLGYVVVGVPSRDGVDGRRVESRIGTLDSVEYVESDHPLPVSDPAAGPAPVAAGAADRGTQDVLGQVNAPEAWDALAAAGAGDREVVVAVVDTGVDYDHNDLVPQFGAELGYDAVDRLLWAAPSDDPAPEDGVTEYHGTHVAGIAGASRDGTGIAGVADVTLRAYRSLSAEGWTPIEGAVWGRPSTVATAIATAAADGADVITMSLGFPVPSRVVREAIAFAVERGALPVAAAGNTGDPRRLPDPLEPPARLFDRRTDVWYPAAFEECLAVSAVDGDESLAGYSRYGDPVDVTAPGTRVLSAMPGEYRREYARLSGTSMATPVVAGVAALAKKRHPDLTVGKLRRHVLRTARDVGLSRTEQGAGHVDALRAVTTPVGE